MLTPIDEVIEMAIKKMGREPGAVNPRHIGTYGLWELHPGYQNTVPQTRKRPRSRPIEKKKN